MSHPPDYVQQRIHVLTALCRAVDSHAEVGTAIARSATEDEALTAVRDLLGTTEVGARAVLETQFRRLLPGEREKLRAQLDELLAQA
ncbi:hypothetical protein [Lentzea sp. NBRC 102530]|uniref:hypothetical protein n=1 Tax=Lentzea sp. NBRC 102530 TaxID=3032201 RepID=UPI002553A038|nr:hypothetical protein [Lentzea sp. NBRC 102530]